MQSVRAWVVAVASLLAGPAGWAADEGAPDEEPAPEAPTDDGATSADGGDTDADDDSDDDSDDDADADGDTDDTDDARAPASTSPTEPVRRGLQLQGSLGLSDCTGGLCGNGDELRFTNTRIGLGLDLSGWYRPIALLAFGGGIHYNLLGAQDRERVENGLDYFTFALGGRVHPLQSGPLDAFGGLVFGYFVYGVSSHYTELDTDQTETTNAFFAALQVGGDFYLAPRMSVGGLLQLTIPFWMRQCFDGELGTDCDDVSELPDPVQDDFPSMVWYVGGTFSYHLGG